VGCNSYAEHFDIWISLKVIPLKHMRYPGI